MILSYRSTEFIRFSATVLWLFQACPGIDSFNAAMPCSQPLVPLNTCILLDVLLCSIAEYFYEFCRILATP